jgi:hypothetical protein
VLCARCGERIWRDENAGDDETPLCQSCYDHCYLSCADCGASSTRATPATWMTMTIRRCARVLCTGHPDPGHPRLLLQA